MINADPPDVSRPRSEGTMKPQTASAPNQGYAARPTLPEHSSPETAHAVSPAACWTTIGLLSLGLWAGIGWVVGNFGSGWLW
jgi:hypothetical protein